MLPDTNDNDKISLNQGLYQCTTRKFPKPFALLAEKTEQQQPPEPGTVRTVVMLIACTTHSTREPSTSLPE